MLKENDRTSQLDRLKEKVTKTTRLYVRLQGENPSVKRPAYVELNPQRTHAIATIFSMRSGNPQLAAVQQLRHLSTNDKCSCGQIEDIHHFIEECKMYDKERKDIKKTLRSQVLLQLTLLDCCLSGSNYEAKLSSMSYQR